MTSPVYGGDARATGTGMVAAALAPAALAPATPASALLAPASPASVVPGSAPHPAPAVRAVPAPRTGVPAEASSSRELSSTSAVGLVLAGGAVLVIAGQLLRLRMRLRRERRGEADEH
ncbi:MULTISPECIES: hypothetical protein [unclassified Streptomyces]|nr:MULTISPECIES: hypothetical protein [unclassified Streptomyces]